MKPKDWLFQNGHIKEIGRGRMSAANIALIKEAVAKGVVIEGYSVSTKPSATADSVKPEIQKVKTDSTGVANIPDMVRDELDWSAHIIKDGKSSEIGFRTVENGCGSSLGWCHCPNPRVWRDNAEHHVTFRQRKGV